MECVSINTLVAGNLLSSDNGLTSALINDVLDSLLFSQLYADTKAPKFDAPAQWFSHHDRAMQKLKWVGSDYQRKAFVPADSASITIEALIEERLLSQLSDTRADDVKKLVACIAELPETDAASVLLRKYALKVPDDAQGNSTIALQISALEQKAQLSSLFVTFSTTSAVEPDPFRQIFPGSAIIGEVDVRFFQRGWDAAEYRAVRTHVRDFLADKKNGLILPISCEAPVGGFNG